MRLSSRWLWLLRELVHFGLLEELPPEPQTSKRLPANEGELEKLSRGDWGYGLLFGTTSMQGRAPPRGRQ